MKKYLNIVPAIFCLVFILSCNETKRNNESSSATTDIKFNLTAFDEICNSSGIGNSTIRKKEADSMTQHFKDIYINPLDRVNLIKDSFWVDGCAIIALGKFINTDTMFTGVRIIFAAAEIRPGVNETKIFFVPTKDTLRSKTTMRDDKWDLNIPGVDCKDAKKYFSNYRNAQRQLELFDMAYRNRPAAGAGTALKDSLSRKVWINKCVFSKLAEFIENNPTLVDGINVKLGAYFIKNSISHKGQGYANQSTIIIIPTTDKTDNWKIVELIKEMVVKKFKLIDDEALNHGELCPQICD